MTPEIAYALAWIALAALMTWVNLKSASTPLKVLTLAALLVAVALAFLTLLGIVEVPA